MDFQVDRSTFSKITLGTGGYKPVDLTEAGVIVGGVPTIIMTRMQLHTVEKLRATGMLLAPLVPLRTVVQEDRETSEWYGDTPRASRWRKPTGR